MMLALALLTLAALAVLPEIVQQTKRDNEEEMRHRGTQYMRAVQRYYKKFGRYPTRLEELENTNQLRFLRKRYKDPLFKDKEFKLVRVGDPILNMLGMGGVGQGPGQAVGPGGRPGFVAGPGGGVRPSGPGDVNLPQVTGLPQQQNLTIPNPATGDSANPDAQVDAKSASSSVESGSPGTQVFGGGPILGVASTSKAKTIRIFNKKEHYNDWLFIYDPGSDRGGLLVGPIQPDASKGLGRIQPSQGAAQSTPSIGPGGPAPPQPAPGPQPGPGQEPPEQ